VGKKMTVRVITQTEMEAQNKLIATLKSDPTSAQLAGSVEEKTTSDKKDTLMNALLKYIPVTIIVGYTFLDSVFRSVTPVPENVWMGSFIVLLIAAFILTYKITEGAEVDIAAMVKEKPDLANVVKNWQDIIKNQRLKQSVIAVIAFAGYVMCLGGPFTALSDITKNVSWMTWMSWQPYYGSVALVFATVLIAIIAAKDLLAS
jgi:hypothetical protein